MSKSACIVELPWLPYSLRPWSSASIHEPHPDFFPPAGMRFFRLDESGEFFAKQGLRHILGGRPVDFALIDGLHLFEQALDDLCHLENHMAPGGMVAVHDTIPLDGETSARVRTTEFYSGDVWKIVPYLCRNRPELEIVTVPAAPTGLSLIRGFNPRCHPAGLLASAADFRSLAYDYFARHHQEFLRTIPNQRAAVEAFCQKTPVQSMVSSGVAMPQR